MWPTTGGWTGDLKRVCVTAPHPHIKSAPPRCWLATSTGRIGSRAPAACRLTPSASPRTPPVRHSSLPIPFTSAYLLRATAEGEEEGGYVEECRASGSHARRMQFPRLHWGLAVVYIRQLPPLLRSPPPPPRKERNPKVFSNPSGVLTQSFTALLRKPLPHNYVTLLPSLIEHTHFPTHTLMCCPPVCQLPLHSVSPHPKCPRRGY